MAAMAASHMTGSQGATRVADWSVDDTYNYMFDLPWVEKEFVHQLRDQAIDGAALLELTKDDLREDFGIAKLGHCKMVLRHIQRIAQDHTLDSQGTMLATMSASGWASPGSSKTLNTTLGGSRAGLNDTTGTSALDLSEIKMFPIEESLPPEVEEVWFNSPPLGGRRKVPKRFQAARRPLSQSAGLGLSQTWGTAMNDSGGGDLDGVLEAFTNDGPATTHKKTATTLPEIQPRRSATSQGACPSLHHP